jgi:MoxR-like ATPase
VKHKKRNILEIFESHGVEFTGERGDQMYGFDPFSGKDDKFYVNVKSGLWDSKSAGLSGNIAKFLELRSENYTQELKGSYIRQLAENRQLKRDAFRGIGMGWDGKAFTFPVRDFDNHVQDIRRYVIRSKLMMSTRGCRVGLWGAEQLKMRPQEPVYLCEGEWDAIALRWLLLTLKEPGVVVAVPGAGTFKNDWLPWLRGRTVHTLYDYDAPGRKGEELAQRKLLGVVRKLTFVHWPDEVPIGFDTRDWIVYGTSYHDTPDVCWERLQRRFNPKPRWATSNEPQRVVSKSGKITIKKSKAEPSKKWKIPPTLEQVHEVFNRWLFLRTTEVIDVMMATVLSQRIDGSPVWLFLVGPPGSAKTAIVSSLQEVEGTYSTSTLTAPSLISGANFAGAGDPSLIPKLADKVLVVKDFTSILSLPDREQKEIFGILRDAYDGRCGKSFGNGVERHYESRFTVLAATTPRIYDLAEQHAALGERFLKFLVGDNLHHESENEVIRKAIENADRETAMRQELQDVVKAFLERTCEGRKHPTMPQKILLRIVALAKFGARLRGSVSRDFYRNDIVMSRPMAEVGTRLGQQLAKMARGMAMVYGRDEVTEVEYDMIKKVMLDTISQRNEDVLRTMIGAMGGSDVLTPISMRELATKTHYPFATIQRLMQDLQALQIIKRHGAGSISTWTLSDYVRKEVVEAQLYNSKDLTARPVGRIRLLRRRKKEMPRKIRIAPGKIAVSTSGSKITINTPASSQPQTGPAVAPAAAGSTDQAKDPTTKPI